MTPKPHTTYAVASLQTWELVRTAYLSGLSGPAAAARFGVSVSALRKRARREGWTKTAYVQALQSPGPAGKQGEGLAAFPRFQAALPPIKLDAAALAKQALERACAALDAGRPAEATAHARAAEAIARLEPLIHTFIDGETPEEAQWRHRALQEATFELALDMAGLIARGETPPRTYEEAIAQWRSKQGR